MGAAAGVLAYDPDRKVAILVRQFRAPVFVASGETALLEVIAGIVDEDDAVETARREAMEEAGVVLTTLEHVTTGWASPGVSTERMDLYLAAYRAGARTGAGGGVAAEGEDITVVEMPLSDLARMADAGEIHDVKTFALIQTLRLKHPDLFAD